jgi:hypothetical protein
MTTFTTEDRINATKVLEPIPFAGMISLTIPLSDTQIRMLYDSYFATQSANSDFFLGFARIIERAHGIA